MNRDNWLYVTIGLLLGFIAGYLMHEVMAARQPPRLAAGMSAPNMGDASGDPSSPSNAPFAGAASPTADPAAPAGAGGPPMAEIQRLREQIEKNPQDADSILLLANLNFDIRNWARAKDLYERYLTLRSENADVLTDLGVSLRELGQFPEALQRFDRAAAMAPQHWQSRYNKVVVLGLDLKDYAKAEVALKELEQLQPGNSSVADLAAEILRRKQGGAVPAAGSPPKTGA